jgi:hypothetical protein
MKKLCSVWLALSILVISANAYGQATKPAKDSTKTAKKAAKSKLKADKAKAVSANAPAPTVKPAPAPKPEAKPATTPATKTVTQGVNKTADKAVGTDAKGRTIYQGPKGGRYTLTAAGNKEYIKKTN